MQKTRICYNKARPFATVRQPYLRRSFLCEACYLPPIKSAGSMPTIRQQAHTGYRDGCRSAMSCFQVNRQIIHGGGRRRLAPKFAHDSQSEYHRNC